MKDIHEVMRQKELAVERLKKEIEALRIVVPMLQDEETTPVTTYSATQSSESRSAPPNTGTTTDVVIWE